MTDWPAAFTHSMTTTAAFSYLAFHAVFLAPPVVALSATAVVHSSGDWARTLRLGIPLMVVLALAYTTPWDNYLIARGVWWYGDGAVGARVWFAPVEEYLFIAVQPVFTALWLSRLPAPGSGPDGEVVSAADGGLRAAASVDQVPDTAGRVPSWLRVSVRNRLLGGLGGGVVAAVGWWLMGSEPTFYMGAILLWAGPVLALQWAFGWPYLWRVRRTVALGVAVPTAYLWVADRIALWAGVWAISPRYTIDLTIVGLPVEEATFFLMTNLFVSQGLVLLQWVVQHR